MNTFCFIFLPFSSISDKLPSVVIFLWLKEYIRGNFTTDVYYLVLYIQIDIVDFNNFNGYLIDFYFSVHFCFNSHPILKRITWFKELGFIRLLFPFTDEHCNQSIDGFLFLCVCFLQEELEPSQLPLIHHPSSFRKIWKSEYT